MHKRLISILLVNVFSLGFSGMAFAGHGETVNLDEVSVTATTDSRIAKHPATVETYDKKQIAETVNATTAAQTLKYLPSIQVRERYVGDRNGIIASRTIGTLSSAQSLLYADGVLLSNLLGNSFAFPPRWGMVSVDEIDSISMMYGPFSALYAGNSFGGIMSIHTRMPEKLEAHANVQAFTQNFALYGTDAAYHGDHLSASIGSKVNDFSFWLGVDGLHNQGQPMTFSQSNASLTAAGAAPVVTGAYLDKSEKNVDRVSFGATSIDTTTQTNIKFKAAYAITPELKVSYTLGLWDLDSITDVQSYIKDAAGNAVYNGRVGFNGKRYDVAGMNPAEVEAFHVMQALDLKSNSKDFFDWNITLSDYDYQADKTSAANPITVLPATFLTTVTGNPYLNRMGRVTDLSGTGWTVLDARGTLRPQGHTIDIGYHVDHYQLRSETSNTADWSQGVKGSLFGSSQGETQTQALYVQDKWQINPQWALTVGARAEYWQAYNGRNQTTTTGGFKTSNYDEKSLTRFSPKLSLSFEPQPAWGFRAAFGQAYRFATVSELYQQVTSGANLVQNNPDLKPEEVLSAEFTAERRFDNGLIRASLFNEHKYDALISQTITTGTGCLGTQCTFIQNIDHIRTQGVELASEWQDVGLHGLDIHANATVTSARILRNDAAPATEGNHAVRIPQQMVKLVGTYHQGSALSYSLAARYSGRQYNYLDNSDVNPTTYNSASRFFVMDAKVTYNFAKRWAAALGVDNLNNYKAYVVHPYPQRTGYLQVKFDY